VKRNERGKIRIRSAGEAGTRPGSQVGHSPNQAWWLGIAPATVGSTKRTGE
jgi:hypothetical protein